MSETRKYKLAPLKNSLKCFLYLWKHLDFVDDQTGTAFRPEDGKLIQKSNTHWVVDYILLALAEWAIIGIASSLRRFLYIGFLYGILLIPPVVLVFYSLHLLSYILIPWKEVECYDEMAEHLMWQNLKHRNYYYRLILNMESVFFIWYLLEHFWG